MHPTPVDLPCISGARTHLTLCILCISCVSPVYLPCISQVRTLESFPEDHLASAIALYERFDADGDGRLQPDEFSRMLELVALQQGTRFSEHARPVDPTA